MVRGRQREDAQPARHERRRAGGHDGPGDLGGGGGEGGAEGAGAGDLDGVGAVEDGEEAFHVADVWVALVGVWEEDIFKKGDS